MTGESKRGNNTGEEGRGWLGLGMEGSLVFVKGKRTSLEVFCLFLQEIQGDMIRCPFKKTTLAASIWRIDGRRSLGWR